MKIRNILPYSVYRVLWGDRRKYGLEIDYNDYDYSLFQSKKWNFYDNTQNTGIGDKICNMAYSVISKVDFTGKEVLEVGPGIIRHIKYLNSKPKVYRLCDFESSVLEHAEKQLHDTGIKCETFLSQKRSDYHLPFKDEAVDIVFSFNL